MPPKAAQPWRKMEHEGVAYLVRFSSGVCWVSRISDRAVWMFDPDATAPPWTWQALL